jgi:hypothetical protein
MGWQLSGNLPLECGDMISLQTTLPTNKQISVSAGEGTVVIGEETFAIKQDGRYLSTLLLPLDHSENSPGIRFPALRVFGIIDTHVGTTQSAYEGGYDGRQNKSCGASNRATSDSHHHQAMVGSGRQVVL